MGFIAAIKTFFTALGEVFGLLKDQQLINAGKDIEKGKQLENALEDIKHVKQVKQDVADLDDADLDSELQRHRDASEK